MKFYKLLLAALIAVVTMGMASAQDKEASYITIAMNGDIMTGSIKPEYDMPPNDGKDIFIDCDSIIRSADVAC